MNTPVTFPIAKLLKEKGYRKYGCKIYHTETELRDFPDMVKCSPTCKSRSEIYESIDDIYLAPTISDVVMWLYEKHDIWIFTDYTNKLFYWTIQKGEVDYLHQEDIILGTTIRNDGFNSPTEAYLAAIEYTLNNLT